MKDNDEQSNPSLGSVLRSTRASMIGTDDEQHYWDCQRAADELERSAASAGYVVGEPAHNKQEPFAWAIEVSEGAWSFTHMLHVAKLWPQAEAIPLYRSPALTDAEREEVRRAREELLSGIRGYDNRFANEKRRRAAVLAGLLERLGGER